MPSSPLPDPSPASKHHPPSAAASIPDILNRSESGPANYSFLVHSPDTLPQHLPPAIDNKSLARQRRRRTSPDDQAILEAEYRSNPKPDKARRMAIVCRVALGEKEVQVRGPVAEVASDTASTRLTPGTASAQIWFQNRRQNARRKTKSWSAEDRPSTRPASVAHDEPARPSEFRGPPSSSQWSDLRSGSVREPGSQSASQTSFVEPSTHARDPLQIEHSDRPHPSSREPRAAGPPAPTAPLQDASSQPRRSRRNASVVHLRLSLDGKAQVVTEAADDDDDIVSPPPPLLHPAGRPTVPALPRSQSALTSRQSLAALARATSTRSGTRRLDPVPTWDLYCDGDAENHGPASPPNRHPAGSAASAIARLRAGSQNSLRPNPAKRHPPSSRAAPAKRSKSHAVKATPANLTKPGHLTRAQSSLARLQSRSGESKSRASPSKDGSAGSATTIVQYPSADSDKENCAPEDDDEVAASLGHRRRKVESTAPWSATSMWSEFSRDEEDMACVQNLLSLSQGSWR
ncbi:MAG: hypothetical protein M1826_004332 [Phylliscum demangeonii]|nr:MAG: hypothetical protein M1826_004332 [Phylliscum demangeonii]